MGFWKVSSCLGIGGGRFVLFTLKKNFNSIYKELQSALHIQKLKNVRKKFLSSIRKLALQSLAKCLFRILLCFSLSWNIAHAFV